jgi:hypothetical protein
MWSLGVDPSGTPADLEMNLRMAVNTERNQVLLRVGSGMAAEFPVVHLKVRTYAAGLTLPAVATQDLLAQAFV